MIHTNRREMSWLLKYRMRNSGGILIGFECFARNLWIRQLQFGLQIFFWITILYNGIVHHPKRCARILSCSDLLIYELLHSCGSFVE